MVNTEQKGFHIQSGLYYNILNIVVNTEHLLYELLHLLDYNILNIVVNTELKF